MDTIDDTGYPDKQTQFKGQGGGGRLAEYVISLDDVRVFLQNISTLNNYQIVSLSITDQDYLQDTVSSDGQAILVSKDGTDNWTGVHNWLKDEFDGKI